MTVAYGEVEIGDNVRIHQRRYPLRGFTRASSSQQQVILEDPETGEFLTVPLAEIEPLEDGGD
jgi:hypothetical protein